MTDYLVRLSQHSPGALASGWVPADEVAVTGSISCRPYAPDIHAARVHAEGPDRIILPDAFTVKLVNGECTLHLRPTDAWWCWEIREQVDNGRIRHLSVADSAEVENYTAAVDVDPTTLEVAASAVPAWTAAVDAVQVLADDAHADALAADGSADAALASERAAAALVDVTVTTGAVVGDDLILTRTDATTTNAGNVRGPQGTPGATGPANTLAIGTVTTGAAGSSASATITGAAPSQTLDLTIPRGATGMPSSLVDVKGDLLAGAANDTIIRLPVGSTGAQLTPDSGAASGLRWTTRLVLEGAGSPLGVVSAPVGSVYYDTAGTCGAWEWLKTSGTGSTGWVVTVGDTGERALVTWDAAGTVTGALPTGVSPLSGYAGGVWIRRIGRTIHYRIAAAWTTAAVQTWPVPSGWAQLSPYAVVLVPYNNAGVNAITPAVLAISALTTFVPASCRLPVLGIAPVVLVWTNDREAWPTTLPGS